MQNKGKMFGKSCEGGFALTTGLLLLPVFDILQYKPLQNTVTLRKVAMKKTHELCRAHV